MELTDEDVRRILELLEQSTFDYLHVEAGDLKLTVSRSGILPHADNHSAPSPAAAPQSEARPASSSTAAAPAVPAATPAATVGTATPKAAPVREGLVTVKAPMVGTFYRAPEPGAPPFVEQGATVDEDDTMGLIEVMKVFNSIRAGVRGVVEEVLVENAQFVEYGQDLFLVRPESGA